MCQHHHTLDVVETPAAGCCGGHAQAETSHNQEASSCCGGHANAAPTQTSNGHSASSVVAADEDVAHCPVMVGTPVVKSFAEAQGLFRDHDGTRYWFCCPACGPLFDADPAKYAGAHL